MARFAEERTPGVFPRQVRSPSSVCSKNSLAVWSDNGRCGPRNHLGDYVWITGYAEVIPGDPIAALLPTGRRFILNLVFRFLLAV
jgi:hypothetical protein